MKKYDSYRLEVLRPIATWVVVCASAFLLFGWLPAGRQLELDVFRKLNFWFRAEIANRAPTLDPRIRIFSFDDQTAGVFQKFDFRMRDWIKLLRVIAEKRPASIFVDKIWSMPIGENFDLPLDEKQAERIRSALADIPVPITVGGSVFERSIFRRQPVNMSRPEYQIKRYIRAPGIEVDLDGGPWQARIPGYFFGPQHLIEAGFRRIGQLDYFGSGQVFAMIRTSKEHVVPHAGLLASLLPMRVSSDKLSVGDHEVPLDSEGHLLVNFGKPSLYNSPELTKSLAPFIYKANRGEVTDEILPGDYVVILPAMFTGNVDWASTPVGSLQGGFVPVAILNSALSGQWLRPVGWDALWIIIACICAGMGAYFLPTVIQIPYILTLTAGIVACGLWCFAYLGLVISWGLPAISLAATGMVCFFERARLGEYQSRKLREALEGTVPPERLAELLRPGALLKDPSEQVVTVMFIDMVSFSLAAERLTPKVAFDDLKTHLGFITQIIHSHGGVIDKFLGDGVLCFFGYSFTEGSQIDGHPETAIRCAIDIQRFWQQLAMESGRKGAPIYPLRIGVNTAPAYIGDVGRGHVHFTMIGQGVNFASRLESACEPFKIMMGETTALSLPADLADSGALQKRFIQVKHHDELFMAYEMDPFFENPELFAECIAAFRKSMSIERRNQRFPVEPGALWLDFGMGSAQIVNFSRTGFAVESSVYPAVGVRMKTDLLSTSDLLNRSLFDSALLPLIVEVRWGHTIESGSRYRLGFEIKSLNESQLELLHDMLTRHMMVGRQRKVA